VGKNGPSGSGGSGLFRGITNLNLDAKGRMAMPTRYRDLILERCDGRLVVTIDTDERCLLIYPMPDWELIEGQINAMANVNPRARRFQRLLVGYATETDMDTNGRLLLTTPLRQYAGLDKRTVLIGQGKKLELWDEENWNIRRDTWLEETTLGGEDLPPELATLSL